MRRLRVCLGGPDGERCAELSQEARCPRHAVETKRRRDRRYRGEHRDVYASPRWRALRREVLRESPWCQAEGCQNAASDVDHVVPMAAGGAPLDRANLQSLCRHHHSAKTAREVWGRK